MCFWICRDTFFYYFYFPLGVGFTCNWFYFKLWTRAWKQVRFLIYYFDETLCQTSKVRPLRLRSVAFTMLLLPENAVWILNRRWRSLTCFQPLAVPYEQSFAIPAKIASAPNNSSALITWGALQARWHSPCETEQWRWLWNSFPLVCLSWHLGVISFFSWGPIAALTWTALNALSND